MAIIACILQKFSALKHSLKLKKHAECFFKQNLKTNSAAVKQYLESLSPNSKAPVLVNDSAAHQKQQQSLLPENEHKYYVMMLMHTGNTKSLSLQNRKFKL
jgi:hypothetical protein